MTFECKIYSSSPWNTIFATSWKVGSDTISPWLGTYEVYILFFAFRILFLDCSSEQKKIKFQRFPLLSLTAGKLSEKNENVINGPLDRRFFPRETLAPSSINKTIDDWRNKNIKLLFMGDVMPIQQGVVPKPHPRFHKFLKQADLVICNIETPV